MKFLNGIKPGVMISQFSPKSLETEGMTFCVILEALELDFFEAFQTVHVPYKVERKEINKILKRENKELTYCITRFLNSNGCNLSSLDKTVQKSNIDTFKISLDEAAEIGADRLCVISGAKPELLNERQGALASLKECLSTMSEMSKSYDIKLTIEPLDYYSHKKNTLGTTSEALHICRQLAKDDRYLGLCLDTAHMILNEENVCESIQLAEEMVDEFHLCNCVTDKEHELFGDNHIPFGTPGVVSELEISHFLKALTNSNACSSGRQVPVFCEVMNRESKPPVEMMQYSMELLKRAKELM